MFSSCFAEKVLERERRKRRKKGSALVCAVNAKPGLRAEHEAENLLTDLAQGLGGLL